jgi:hypothetical protein
LYTNIWSKSYKDFNNVFVVTRSSYVRMTRMRGDGILGILTDRYHGGHREERAFSKSTFDKVAVKK